MTGTSVTNRDLTVSGSLSRAKPLDKQPFKTIHAAWQKAIHAWVVGSPFMVSLMSLIATALVLAGVMLGIAGLYEMAGDAEPDGSHPETQLRHKKGPKL